MGTQSLKAQEIYWWPGNGFMLLKYPVGMWLCRCAE